MSVRVVAAWCAAQQSSSRVAVLLALDDGYYLSCRRLDPNSYRVEEFDCFFRERGNFRNQEEADKWAAMYFRVPVKQAFDVDMKECPIELLDSLGVQGRGLRR